MAASAGKNIRVRVSGVALAFTNEATTGSGNISYQITSATKRVWDPASTVTVKDGGIATVESYTVNRLTGTITFASATSRVITVSGDYLPLSTLAEAKDLSLKCAKMLAEDNAFGDADVTRVPILKDCSGNVGRWLSVDTYLNDAFEADTVAVVDVSFDSGSTIAFRAWARFNENTFGGDRKSLLEEGAAFQGSADADGRSHAWLI